MRVLKHEWIQDPITLDRKKTTVLVLENPKFFREFVLGVSEQIEDDEHFLICHDDLKEFQLSKCALLITNLFDIPIDEKKTSTLLYKDMEKSVSDEVRTGLERISMTINSFIADLIEDYSIPLTYTPNLSLTSLMKLVDVRPEYHPSSFLQALLDRIRTLSSLFKKNLFFVVNIHDVLEHEELAIFYEEVALMDIDLIILDSREPKAILPSERVVIIDSDLCEILKS